MIFLSMCVNPLHIPNKGFNPKDVLSSPFVDVNCRHCWQCQLQRSNDMSFRMLQELPNSVPFFVTLTYNDKFLPLLSYRSYVSGTKKPIIKSISVWNKKHVQDLHKRVRRKLHYYYGVPKDSFKFLCCCERGSDNIYTDFRGIVRQATLRPHYHLLYMLMCLASIVPIRKLPKFFYDYCRYHEVNVSFSSFFQYLLSSEWYFGHVDNVAFCRDVTSATSYVTKYCTKQKNEPLSSIDVSDIFSYYDFDSISKDYDVSFSNLVPRSFSSINLGASFLSNPSFLDYVFGRKVLCIPYVRSASRISVPQYYINKVSKFTSRLSKRSVRTSYVVSDEGYHELREQCSKSPELRKRWSFKRGVYTELCYPSYTSTSLTPLGRKIRRSNFVRNFKRFVIDSRNNILNYSFSNSLINNFKLLPHDLQNVLQFPSVSDFRSFRDFDFCSDSLFLRFVALRHLFFDDLVTSDPSFETLNNLINLNKICTFTSTHLRHLAFEHQFKSKLNHSVIDNPELFLNHYI